MSGEKWWMRNGNYGRRIIVRGVTDDDEKGGRMIWGFIVEKGEKGVWIRKAYEKMGVGG